MSAATAWLERHAPAVNAINVFPVPDGDTGTNMFLTMRSTLEEVARSEPPADAKVEQVLAAVARGALLGARGNSGVILSQILRGLARSAEGAEALDAAVLAAGLEEGADSAYKAVTNPVEGTILTVVRDSAAAARDALSRGGPDLIGLMETVVAAAKESVDRTPTLLPVLAEAGVVDAGGQGLYVLLDGMARHLKGEEMEPAPVAEEAGVGQEWLAVTHQLHEREESLYGYCTEFLVSGESLNADSIRSRMQVLGDSVLVVGDERLVRVHVHTNDPGAALSQGTGVGNLVQVKVDNIRQQADRFLELHGGRQGVPATPAAAAQAPPQAINVVAVASGEGMQGVLRSVGATSIVSGGPTMNPSTREILAAVDECPADDVIILPNDKNIILAAEQAVDLAEKRIKVVPTRSVPQGIAALLAMNQEEDVEANASAMAEAAKAVRTIEVSRAVRATSVKGIKIAEGQAIAIVDDELTLAAESPEAALLEAVSGLLADGPALLTIYYGADTPESEAKPVAAGLSQRHPNLETEVVSGGQPHYHYIASLE
ncbi:MAG: DAK2 domain-containing protein [Chloroflexi bacterium]|nr:DAK2 domain-containing protein [Chloroflexota bacterium]